LTATEAITLISSERAVCAKANRHTPSTAANLPINPFFTMFSQGVFRRFPNELPFWPIRRCTFSILLAMTGIWMAVVGERAPWRTEDWAAAYTSHAGARESSAKY
jgi:hypothetical protein